MNKKEEANAFVKECITTALITMMNSQSFESINITDLTKKAGVGRVSFYRNFESKEDVLRKHLKCLLENWAKEHSQKESLHFVEAVFAHFYDNRDIYLLLSKNNLSHISLQSIKDVCGPKPEQENIVAYTTAYFSYGLYGWIEEWFYRGMPENPQEMARLWDVAQQIK